MDLSIVAILAAYNESDIIEQVVCDLIDQGVEVYFLDDGSTDDTKAIVARHVGHGVLAIEDISRDSTFNLERIVARKAALAAELDATWFINQDADEFRESPWNGLSLKEAIRHVDRLGFNAIDFATFDFWPTHDNFRPGMDVREAFPFYSEGGPHNRLQIRCWKKSAAPVDLVSTAGHDTRFDDRRVFPLRFVLRHYPIRGQAHGERKVFGERMPRFSEAERALGWHVQYDHVQPGESFIKDPATLIRYDADAVRVALALRHRWVEALEESLAAERAETENLRSELSGRTQELQERTRERDFLGRDLTCAIEELGRARTEIHGLASQAKDLIADLGSHEKQLRATERALRDRDADIRAHRAAIQGLNAQAAALFADLDAHARQLGLTETALAERDADLVAHRRAIGDLRTTLQEKTTEIEQWQNALDDSVRRIAKLQRSLSWRAMAPARAIYRFFRGRSA